MATKFKRAQWIEGITQSKRILRDLADIATSGVRDEHGIVDAENWELVFPRPFNEESVTRKRMIRDATNPKKFIPVIGREEFLRLTGTTAANITDDRIVADTLHVYREVSPGEPEVEYVLGTDFNYDPTTNAIIRIEGGGIVDQERVRVVHDSTFYKVLDTTPLLVEKELMNADPDRLISAGDYTIDYAAGKVKFLDASRKPANAAHFALTFREKTGTFSRTEKELLQLELDGVDPDELTYLLPAGTGAITQPNVKTEIAGTVTGGTTGQNSNSTLIYTLDGTTQKVVFNVAPNPTADQTLLLKVAEYTDGTFTTVRQLDNVLLVADSADATGKTYKPVSIYNRFNESMPHSILLAEEVPEPKFYLHLADLSAGFENLDVEDYIISYDPPMITTKHEIPENLYVSLTSRTASDREAGLNRVTDRIVLKTVTEQEQEFTASIYDRFGAKDTMENLPMYVEFIKPIRLVNPETGLERYADWKKNLQQTQPNNHYIQARMFDSWDDSAQRPTEPSYNADGSVKTKGAYVSDWSKYAWFQDWKEFPVDELDDDPGAANASDGIILQEVITQGMTDEFPIQFWVSTNNNRMALILMGDPTLDQDNFLTSFGYFGRIHPFYDKSYVVKRETDGTMVLDTAGNPILEEVRTYFENDVAGNFAITTGSSTLPVSIGTPPKGSALILSTELNMNREVTPAVPIVGDLYSKSVYSYLVTYLTQIGESKPTPVDAARLIIPVDSGATTPNTGYGIKLRFRLPEEATGYRIYRYNQHNAAAFSSLATTQTNYRLVTSVEKLDRDREITYVDGGDILPMHQVTIGTGGVMTTVPLPDTTHSFYNLVPKAAASARSYEAVLRDSFTGAIIEVKFSEKFGKDTATGVNDISMFQTRSGLKYQRHQASFVTTEEFMRKEKSGQSRWTGKFHLSPVYVEHSYDKQRGWLDGVMAVDDSGIEHLDELIVDKDTAEEEVYKFFRVSAPYSMFNNSPNYAYGVAIIKTSMKWT